MMTKTLRSTVILMGAALAVILGAPAAIADSDCPCFSGDQVDTWVQSLARSTDSSDRKLLCVDDPGFTTFDLLDRADDKSIYIDVTYATNHKPARCLVEVSGVRTRTPEYKAELFSTEARACRQEILESKTWSGLRCPNN